TGGRITVELVAGCSWNRWPDGRGIRTKAFAGQVECKQLVSNCAAGYSSPPNYARAGCTFEYVNNPEIHTALELAGLTASP
ncbi:hypothetical protein, partial [Pseudomonas corrugata]